MPLSNPGRVAKVLSQYWSWPASELCLAWLERVSHGHFWVSGAEELDLLPVDSATVTWSPGVYPTTSLTVLKHGHSHPGRLAPLLTPIKPYLFPPTLTDALPFPGLLSSPSLSVHLLLHTQFILKFPEAFPYNHSSWRRLFFLIFWHSVRCSLV